MCRILTIIKIIMTNIVCNYVLWFLLYCYNTIFMSLYLYNYTYVCIFVSALSDPTSNSLKSANGGNKQNNIVIVIVTPQRCLI